MAALEKMSNQPHHLNQFHHLGYEDDKHFLMAIPQLLAFNMSLLMAKYHHVILIP